MFPYSKRWELHLHAREAFQRWPPSEMTCLKGTLNECNAEVVFINTELSKSFSSPEVYPFALFICLIAALHLLLYI